MIQNLNRQAIDLRIFEIGKTFIPAGKNLPDEITKLAVVVTGRRNPELWGDEEYDFFDIKNVLERICEHCSVNDIVEYEQGSGIPFLHPGKSAKVIIDNKDTGFLGELHPDITQRLEIAKRPYLLEIDIERIISLASRKKIKFSPLPKFPSVRRDISLVVDMNITVGEILDEIKKIDSNLIREINAFDVFTGNAIEKGKKSVAVSMILRSDESTLTEQQINEVQEMALERLQSSINAELRTN
jgi:phenylalanyl-tRNA synthetase beta chain